MLYGWRRSYFPKFLLYFLNYSNLDLGCQKTRFPIHTYPILNTKSWTIRAINSCVSWNSRTLLSQKHFDGLVVYWVNSFCLSLWCFSSAIFSWFWLGILIHFSSNRTDIFIYIRFLSWKLQMNLLKKHILLYVLPVTCQIWGDLVVLVPSILFRRIQILWLFHSNLSDWCSSKVPTQLLWPLKQPASLLIPYPRKKNATLD